MKYEETIDEKQRRYVAGEWDTGGNGAEIKKQNCRNKIDRGTLRIVQEREKPTNLHMTKYSKFFGFSIPILILTSPCLFCTHQLCFLFPVPFPPLSPLPTPPLITLHVLSISVILFLFQQFAQFLFLGLVVNSCEFVVILLFIVLIFFFLDNSF